MGRNRFTSVYRVVKISAFFLLVSLFTCAFMSCGARKGYFKLEGRFLHINQGTMYVYSPDGGMDGMDTITIKAGRFAYERPIKKASTLMLVFPNFSEHPVFAEPGAAVDIEADASHLKEMTVKGTDENKLMNKFREAIANASPPEEIAHADRFIQGHPDSRVSLYLLRRYFIQGLHPDYQQALKLLSVMMEGQSDEDLSDACRRLKADLTVLSRSATHAKLNSFTATDINGQKVTDAALRGGKAVVCVWTSWNFESVEMLRAVNAAWKDSGKKLKVLAVCVDGNQEDCKRALQRDHIEIPCVCDGMMMESTLLKDLGLTMIPDNLLLYNGTVTDHHIDLRQFREELGRLTE